MEIVVGFIGEPLEDGTKIAGVGQQVQASLPSTTQMQLILGPNILRDQPWPLPILIYPTEMEELLAM